MIVETEMDDIIKLHCEDDYLFRGTCEGWPGNDASKNNSATSTSISIFIAYLFAKEAKKKRGISPVILLLRKDKFINRTHKSNYRGIQEGEVCLSIPPLEAFNECETKITLDKFKEIVNSLGIDVDNFVIDDDGFYSIRKVQKEITKIILND